MALQVLIFGLVAGTQVLLVALALHLVYLVSRVHNLALGAVAAAGAYSLYLFVIVLGFPLWISGVLALVVISLLGVVTFLLNESLTRKQEHLLALLVSFSFAIALESLLAIFFGTDGKVLVEGVLPVVSFGSYQVTVSGISIIGLGIATALAMAFLIRLTPFGRRLRAISENHAAAMSLGINQSRTRFFIYIIASIVAGLIGVLVGLDTVITPTMGFQLIIMAFIALLVGGITDIRGVIIASYVVVLVPELVVGLSPGISANWRMVLMFVIASILLIVRPKGILAPLTRKT